MLYSNVDMDVRSEDVTGRRLRVKTKTVGVLGWVMQVVSASQSRVNHGQIRWGIRAELRGRTLLQQGTVQRGHASTLKTATPSDHIIMPFVSTAPGLAPGLPHPPVTPLTLRSGASRERSFNRVVIPVIPVRHYRESESCFSLKRQMTS